MKIAKILNQRIHCVSLDEVLLFVEKKRRNKLSYIFAMNVHNLVELKKYPDFNDQYNQAEVIFADGVPLIWLAKLYKQPLRERVSGTDLVEKILLKNKKEVFLLGATDEIIQKLMRVYPDSISGYYSPPYGDAWNDEIDRRIIKKIRASGARIVLIGVGALKQERWLINNLHKTKCSVGIGVGSAFEILAGMKPRSPKYMSDNGLEWLWRIILEPRRLFMRYVVDVILIVQFMIRDALH